ncbi:MAG: sugar nucleotide-binding protein [Deinococcota bacterium]
MRLYFTGATGFVGSGFLKVALERYGATCFAACNRTTPKPKDNLSFNKVDLTNGRDVLESVHAFQPDAIIHLAFEGDFPKIYADRDMAWQTYVTATRNLVDAANAVSAKMVLISTDWVFDGTQIDATERTPVNPINLYGVLKVICETIVQERAKNGAIARIAGLFGVQWERNNWQPAPDAGFGYLPNAVIRAFEQTGAFQLPFDDSVNQFATPTLTTDAGKMTMKIVQQDKQGVFHCVGSEGISKLELCQLTADIFGFDSSNISIIRPDPQNPANLHGIPVPKDTRLNSKATASALGHTPPNIREALELFKHQYTTRELERS